MDLPAYLGSGDWSCSARCSWTFRWLTIACASWRFRLRCRATSPAPREISKRPAATGRRSEAALAVTSLDIRAMKARPAMPMPEWMKPAADALASCRVHQARSSARWRCHSDGISRLPFGGEFPSSSDDLSSTALQERLHFGPADTERMPNPPCRGARICAPGAPPCRGGVLDDLVKLAHGLGRAPQQKRLDEVVGAMYGDERIQVQRALTPHPSDPALDPRTPTRDTPVSHHGNT